MAKAKGRRGTGAPQQTQAVLREGVPAALGAGRRKASFCPERWPRGGAVPALPPQLRRGHRALPDTGPHLPEGRRFASVGGQLGVRRWRIQWGQGHVDSLAFGGVALWGGRCPPGLEWGTRLVGSGEEGRPAGAAGAPRTARAGHRGVAGASGGRAHKGGVAASASAAPGTWTAPPSGASFRHPLLPLLRKAQPLKPSRAEPVHSRVAASMDPASWPAGESTEPGTPLSQPSSSAAVSVAWWWPRAPP